MLVLFSNGVGFSAQVSRWLSCWVTSVVFSAAMRCSCAVDVGV